MIAAHTFLATVSLATVTCWLCRPVVMPRPQYWVEDGEAQRHAHLLGRQGRLTGLAVALTAIAFVVLFVSPQGVNPDLRDLRLASASCGEQESPYDPPTCYVMQPGGQWIVEEIQADGTRRVIATVMHPAFRMAVP